MTAKTQRDQLRKHFEGDLFEFAKYVNPTYMYGDVHEEIFKWLEDNDNGDQLLLIPRGHLKSHCIAVWVVWMVTKQPWTTIVYLSANETLCKVQLYAIKNMLESDQYKKLWPEMLHPQTAKRDKWTGYEINVDHPLRKKMGTRDFTIAIRTIGGTNTGLHCDVLVLDDIVTDKNAYTTVGREEVRNGVAAFVGVKNSGAITKAVGTRYHPQDIYADFLDAQEPILDDEGNQVGEQQVWRLMEAVVEDSGRGNGNFLWPRVKSPVTQKWYGFDARELAKKKAEYMTYGVAAWFWSQYYNDPNDPGSARVKNDKIQYYNPNNLEMHGGKWYYGGKRLNIYAGMDVSFSDDTEKRADYSAIAVVGIDWDGFIYILELIQYKTKDADNHYKHVIDLYQKWRWAKLKIETNSGGKIIDYEIKKRLRKAGKSMRIDSRAKTREDGAKLERYAIILEPRYEQGIVFHAKGGLTAIYEDQLKKARPTHDDLKDAVTDAMEELEVPARAIVTGGIRQQQVVTHGLFGGRRRASRS